MIPAGSEAPDGKLGRGPKLAAHQQREAIERRDAGAPVRETAHLSLMWPTTCNTAVSGGIEITMGT